MAWRRDESSSFISGSTIYAYTEVDWNVGASRCTYTHLGGVTSPYYWDTSATGTLFWREWSGGAWGAWNEYASGTAYFGGYGDKELVRTDGFFARQAADREVQLACDVTAAGGTGSAWLTYTVPHLPGSPTGLTAQYVNDNRIDLSWTNPSTSYYAFCLEVRIDGGSWSQCWYYNGEGYPTSYSYTSATADHSYEFRARTEYYSAYSAYTAATAAIKTKPAAPSAISTAAIQGSTNVAVTLTNSSKVATGIQWQFSSDGSTWGASSSVSGSPVRSFTATGISGSGYIRVRNVNATGTSGWLTSQKVTTICPPAAPTLRTPSGNVVDMADGSVLFSWLHNSLDGSAQTSYELQYAINGGAAATLSGTTDQERTLSLSGFSAGDAISWKVRTKGADPSFGPWSGSLSFNLYTAPTVSITSPGATITGMPIALTATYSDMAGFTCQSATVSLTQDGQTLFSEQADVSGSSVTASLTVDEFLPANGESYTVVLDVRSSSSLQSSANATFLVDFTEPVEGSLQVSNDPETGYASLAAMFDNTGADEPAVSISVSRVNPDGTVTPLLTDGQSGAGIVDRFAPLNTPYQYAVTTKAASQAVKTVYVDNIFESDHWFAYWGENVAKAKWNPDNGGIQVTRPQKTRVYYAGRRDPVSYDGHAVALTETPSWMFIGKDEVDAFVKLIEDGGRGVYKSCDGWVYHADFDLTLTPSYTAIGYYGGASLGITRIAGERL